MSKIPKEMVYYPIGVQKKRIVLASEEYKGYRYVVLSLGTHPTAYVDIGNDYPLDFKELGKTIICHGGITYKEWFLEVENGEELRGKWIGWDYGHCGDWHGCFSDYQNRSFKNSKHTTAEIINTCMLVIDQLVGLKEEATK